MLAASCAAPIVAYTFYTKSIRRLDIHSTPSTFRKRFNSCSSFWANPQYAFYETIVELPIRGSRMTKSDSIRRNPVVNSITEVEPVHAFEIEPFDDSDLTTFVKAVLGSPVYQLELLLSSTKENIHNHNLYINSKYGNLRLIERPSSHEVIYRYEHEDFDYLLYFGLPSPRTLSLGFIELKGDSLEYWGSLLYLPVLLESGARKLKRDFRLENL
jgi:hypothetical protein